MNGKLFLKNLTLSHAQANNRTQNLVKLEETCIILYKHFLVACMFTFKHENTVRVLSCYQINITKTCSQIKFHKITCLISVQGGSK
jgi:hypothetical protein